MDESLLARLLAPPHLTQQMSQCLDLAGARLVSATPRKIDASGYLSELVGVTLAWDAPSTAPTGAVLKVSNPGFGQGELPFYRDVAGRLGCLVVPRFFAGGSDGPTGRTWVLMEDLSSSHEPPSEEPLPPPFARSAQVVEGLAQLHAAGWNKEGLKGVGPTLGERLRASDWAPAAWERLQQQAGDALDDGARDLYARWLRGLPMLVERAGRIQGTTLVHGDAHVWNWLLPRQGAAAGPKLVDWDGWHVGVAVWDLAYMMALQWDREVRQRFELKLLDRYHAALAACGVAGYSREALQDDYRLAVLLHLRTPLSRFAWKMSPYVWWPQLTRILHAVEDLRCLDFLD